MLYFSFKVISDDRWSDLGCKMCLLHVKRFTNRWLFHGLIALGRSWDLQPPWPVLLACEGFPQTMWSQRISWPSDLSCYTVFLTPDSMRAETLATFQTYARGFGVNLANMYCKWLKLYIHSSALHISGGLEEKNNFGSTSLINPNPLYDSL